MSEVKFDNISHKLKKLYKKRIAAWYIRKVAAVHRQVNIYANM